MSEPRTAAEAFVMAVAESIDLSAKFVIYLIICSINGKGYVGQTRGQLGRRCRSHFGATENFMVQHLFARAVRKYGVKSFSVFIVQRCRSFDELDECEAHWINALETMSPNGYNLKVGGGVEARTASEVGAKISAAKQDMVVSAEWRENISKGRKGKKFGPMSAQGRKNVGDGARGRRWVNDGTIEHTIGPLVQFPEGFSAGRLTSPKGERWITNGVVSKKIRLNERVPEGWMLGRPDSHGVKVSKTLTGRTLSPACIAKRQATFGYRIWITDGTKSRRVHPDSAIPEGWRCGKIHKVKN